MATLGMSAADKEALEVFQRDVIEPSMTSLVILDFWAEWCGPCKALTPVLEKVAADYAGKGVVLKKVNVDEQKFVASQFGIQSIPTVYAFFQGRPVVDLTQARSESQLKQMLDQILRQLPIQGAEGKMAEDIAPLIAMGEEILEGGDLERATGIFSQLYDMAPEHPQVIAGLARTLIQSARLDEAEELLAQAPADKAKDAAIGRAQAALALAREAKPIDDLGPLRDKLAADPDDHETRFELAGGLMAAGDRDGAAEQLLESISRDREWNEGAAKQRFLKLLEMVGLEDGWAREQRRRLSAILFT